MKDKRFAASVSREDIIQWVMDFWANLHQHIQFVIDALKPIAPQLGLKP